MIRFLASIWHRFVLRNICGGKEYDEQDHAHLFVEQVNCDINFIWEETNHAEYEHQFFIIELAIEEFAKKYNGVEKIELVLRDLHAHLSERKDQVQNLFQV